MKIILTVVGVLLGTGVAGAALLTDHFDRGNTAYSTDASIIESNWMTSLAADRAAIKDNALAFDVAPSLNANHLTYNTGVVITAGTWNDANRWTMSSEVTISGDGMWAGVAFNIQDADNFYALRVKSGTTIYQMIRVLDGSVSAFVNRKDLLSPIAAGKAYVYTISCSTANEFTFSITEKESSAVLNPQTVTFGGTGNWDGGYGGFYHGTGLLSQVPDATYDNFRLEVSDDQPPVFDDFQALVPLSGGELDIMREGVKLWSDRNYVATADWPAELKGHLLMRASQGSCKVGVLKAGYLVVVTPTYGQWGGFSDEPVLRVAGFDRADIATFLPFLGAGTNGDTCCVYQKKVEPGDTYKRKNMYGIILWRKDPLPLYTMPKPVPPPVNMNPGPKYADAARMYQGVPSIECSRNGRLWATWFGGGTGEGYLNYIMLFTSGDGGNTWSNLKLVIDPDGDGPLRATEPVVWLDPNGRLWLIWNQYPLGLPGPASETWAIVADNPDSENPTWSAPQLIGYPNMNCTCKPTALSDGTWIWPGSSFYHPVKSRPLLSRDQGATFTPGGELTIDAKDRDWQEYYVTELKDGTLWATIRTKYGMGESFSKDKGQTWSRIKPCGSIIHVPAKHYIGRLKSGRLLLVKHGTIKERVKRRERLVAMLSDDDGQTWSDGLLLDERTGIATPDCTQLPDGTIYLIYDRNRHSDKEILMATFTEEDVLAGADVSGKVRLRVLINKATGHCLE